MFSKSEYVVTLVIESYLSDNPNKAFSYDSIKALAFKSGILKQYGISERTLERTIRAMAEKGVLERIYIKGGKVVLFKATELFWHSASLAHKLAYPYKERKKR